MNLKYILIIFILVIIVGGIFAWQYFGVSKEEAKIEVKVTYSFGKCGEAKLDPVEKLKISSEPSTILFEGFMDANCETFPEAKLFVDYSKKNNEIDLKLIADYRMAKIRAACTCPYSIQGRVENLSSGKYNVNIIDQWFDSSDIATDISLFHESIRQTEELEVK